jgi:hypothetical protein
VSTASLPTILIRDTTIFEAGVLANDDTGKVSGARVWVRYPGGVKPEHSTHEGAILGTDPQSLRNLASSLVRAADDLESALQAEKGRATS